MNFTRHRYATEGGGFRQTNHWNRELRKNRQLQLIVVFGNIAFVFGFDNWRVLRWSNQKYSHYQTYERQQWGVYKQVAVLA